MKSQLVSDTRRIVRRRYVVTFSTAMLAYVVAMAIAGNLFHSKRPISGIGLYLAAILPALPIGLAIFALVRYVNEEPDEFVRMIQVQTLLIAAGLTMFTCTVWGFLILYAHIWPLPLYMVFPMWAVWMGIAKPLIKLKYR